MAGRGPTPKDPAKRARTNSDPLGTTVLEFLPGSQPSIPERMPNGEPWPQRTRDWWGMWSESALSSRFTSNDWSELLDTAVLHGLFWSGVASVATELRLRVAKFGATPEDRARLRIVFAEADKADGGKTPAVPPSSRERRGTLHSLPAVGQ